jgi:uncharacterized protein (TIGR02145 family)
MKNKKEFMRVPFLLIGLFLFFAISCDKDDDNNGDSINTFEDSRDGKVYKTVKIGNQIWMAENLAYAPSNGNYWAYDNDDANVETYGYLYDWQTALNVCPTGWHLPSDEDEEWAELIDFLGGSEIAGDKLKATGTIEEGTGLWHAPNTGTTNETGFKALPGGQRNSDGSFFGIGNYGGWWGAAESSTSTALNRYVGYNSSNVGWFSVGKELGFSVRCLKD